ncbi:MAG: alkaline phosphatase family protein [Candidatus Sulfotelmatobacter sp.]|jgi:phospholipase C
MPATIKHLVVLMMENRSFDHMLGFMQSPTYGIDGLDRTEMNRDSSGEPVRVNKEARYTGDLPNDPSHDFEDVMEQMFGVQSPTAGQQPDMSGFVKNYERFTHDRVKASAIMNCFDPANLPVLATLAGSYAVCDRWFSSVPGPTLPNRAYAHAGSSRGRLDLSPDFLGGFHTVYEVLLKNGISSTIFYEDWTAALSFEALLLHNQAQFFAEYARFPELVQQNKLPSYSFIEPRYNPQESNGISLPANDQHPPDHDIANGEQLIRTVYNDLRRNDEVWKSSILVIVYDEHGGLYDHALPERCVSPDGISCPSPAFDFTWLGPRVPAVIVSPYVQPGHIDHANVYDHTSLIATPMKLFAGQAWPSDVLGKRAQAAKTFDGILNLNMQPRMERPNFANPPAAVAAKGLRINAAAAPLSTLQQQVVDHAAILNDRLPPQFKIRQDPASIQDEYAAGKYVSNVAASLRQLGAGVRFDGKK